MDNRISFRASRELLAEVLLRSELATLSLTARRDLTRYYRLLEAGMPELTEAEFNLLCNLCNDTHFGEFELSPQKTLLVELQHGQHLASKWGVDYPVLLAKVQQWTELQAAAVVDAIEQFWRAQ